MNPVAASSLLTMLRLQHIQSKPTHPDKYELYGLWFITLLIINKAKKTIYNYLLLISNINVIKLGIIRIRCFSVAINTVN